MIKILVILFFVIINSLNGCSNPKKIEENQSNYIINKDSIIKEDSKIRNLDEDDYSNFVVKNGKNDGITLKDNYNIILNNDLKSLKKVNTKNGDIQDFIEVVNKDFYIREYVVNDDYVVWIEGDSKGFGSEYESVIEWSIYSKDLSNNKINLIDKSKYKRGELKLKNHEMYEPNSLDLCDENRLVYRAYDKEKNNIVSLINYYDLEKEILKEIFRTEELMKECVFEPKISQNNISFVRGTNYNTANTRQIFNNIDLYIYNIKKDLIKQVTKDMKVTATNIFNNNIIFSAANSDNEMIDSLYIYNIKENSTKNLLYDGSKAINYLDSIGLNKIMIGTLELDDKYIYIRLQGDYSPLIYNMEHKEFISLKDSIDSMMKNNRIIVTKGKNRLLKVYVNGYEIDDVILEYTLK